MLRVVHAKRGPQGKAWLSVKPMLRIVNMQRRLRPVYPGFGAIDFAIDLRDLRRRDAPAGGRSMQIADNFEI